MRIPDYPAPDRALDGTELLPIWEDGQQRTIPLQSLWSLAAEQNPAFIGNASGFVLAPLTRLALAAVVSPLSGQTAYLAESGQEGMFVFSSANLSSTVSFDTAQLNNVAPASDTTGASGAWVRQLDASALPRGTAVADAAIPAGGLVNLYVTGGVTHMQLADGSDPTKPAHAFCPIAVANGATGYWQHKGIIPGTSGVTFAAALWLSDTTPGTYQASSPTTSGHIAQYVGIVLPGVGVEFSPQMEIDL